MICSGKSTGKSLASESTGEISLQTAVGYPANTHDELGDMDVSLKGLLAGEGIL